MSKRRHIPQITNHINITICTGILFFFIGESTAALLQLFCIKNVYCTKTEPSNTEGDSWWFSENMIDQKLFLTDLPGTAN